MTMLRKAVDEYAASSEEPLLVFDGLDEAIIGVSAHAPGRPSCVVYDYERCVSALMEMEEDEAREWMEYNVVGAWLGERTPIVMIIPVGEE